MTDEPVSTQPPTKKAYHRPEIELYGDIKEITQNAGQKSANADVNPKGANNKTA